MQIRKGDYVYTPRFCTVKIAEIFESEKEAAEHGYTEPTYYKGEYDVLGKSLDMYHMIFAAAKLNNQ